MPRNVNREAQLLDQLQRIRTARAKQLAEEKATERQIAQERYRKQRLWEAKVGRFAWEAGLHVLELSEVQQLINKLTPHDLEGASAGTPDEDYEAAISGNS